MMVRGAARWHSSGAPMGKGCPGVLLPGRASSVNASTPNVRIGGRLRDHASMKNINDGTAPAFAGTA